MDNTKMSGRNRIASVTENTEVDDRLKEAANERGVSLVPFTVAMLLLSLSAACNASAGGGGQEVCDVGADYALGIEDYPETLRLHREVVRKHPNNALAHYHLGFAEGILGHRTAELREYQRAAALGRRDWDLFLNLGLVQLENGDLDAAIDSLQRAVLLGPDHSESHYNLALAFERRGLLADAEREMLASLRLNLNQPDARNSLGVIFAEEGKTVRASLLWRVLVRDAPDYEPARKNLELLNSQVEVAHGETAAVTLLPGDRRQTTEKERKPHLPASEVQSALAQSK